MNPPLPTLNPLNEPGGGDNGLLRAIVDALPDFVYVKDASGRFLMDNLAHAHLLGKASPDEVVGKTVFDLHPPQLAAGYHESDQAIMRTGTPLISQDEPIWSPKRGELVWVSTTKVPLRNKAGKIVGIIGVGRDITERRKAEEARHHTEQELRQTCADLERAHGEVKNTQEAMMQMERMESLGRLAAGIAHEVKNPLSQVILAADYLATVINGQSAITDTLVGHIREAAARIDRIVDGMLDFTGPNEPELCPVDVNDVIEQSLVLLKMELLKSRVEIEKRYDTGLPAILADSGRLSQAFVAICLNAVQAMPEGGTLTIATSSRVFTASERADWQRHGWFRAGDIAVVAEITDTGCGIPREKLGMIFEPFFTTRETGKGTGLGLTVAKKIVELHHGRLEIKNRVEGGVAASLILKTAAQPAASKSK